MKLHEGIFQANERMTFLRIRLIHHWAGHLAPSNTIMVRDIVTLKDFVALKLFVYGGGIEPNDLYNVQI